MSINIHPLSECSHGYLLLLEAERVAADQTRPFTLVRYSVRPSRLKVSSDEVLSSMSEAGVNRCTMRPFSLYPITGASGLL